MYGTKGSFNTRTEQRKLHRELNVKPDIALETCDICLFIFEGQYFGAKSQHVSSGDQLCYQKYK